MKKTHKITAIVLVVLALVNAAGYIYAAKHPAALADNRAMATL